MSTQLLDPATVRRVGLFCSLVALCEGIELQAAGVTAGGLSREFLPTAEQMGLFFSASTLGLFVGAVTGGWLADRIGRKKVLTGSIAIFGVFSLLTSLAGSMDQLIVARLLTGLGLGGALPNLIAFAAETSPVEKRAGAIATMYIGMPLGGAIASLIILVVAVTRWRAVFVIGGAVPLVLAPLMAMFMPESPAAVAKRAGAVTTADALRELFGRGRTGRTLLLWLASFLALLTIYLLLNWLPTLLQGRGASKGEAAAAQIAFNIGGAAGALLVGKLLDTRLRRVSILASFAALILALVGVAAAPAQAGPMILLTLLLGAGALASQSMLYGVAADCYTAANRGTGVGAAVALGRIGSVFGPLFAAVLVSAGRTPSQVLTGVLPVVLVCGISTTVLGWRIGHRPA